MVCIFIFHGVTVKTENTRPSVPSFCELVHNIAGAIHSTKLSGNFGPKINGSVRSNRKSLEKTGPPFEVVLFSQSDRLEFWLNGSRPSCSGRPAVSQGHMSALLIGWFLKMGSL